MSEDIDWQEIKELRQKCQHCGWVFFNKYSEEELKQMVDNCNWKEKKDE